MLIPSKASKCAAELTFLLDGKDGKPDRMIRVEAYMRGTFRYLREICLIFETISLHRSKAKKALRAGESRG
jgi:hypothetical protein